MASQSKSPFAELSYGEQQEQWRQFRAQHLDYRQVEEKREPAAPQPLPRAVRPARAGESAPRHANLDRVQAQLRSAARHAGSFQPVTSRE